MNSYSWAVCLKVDLGININVAISIVGHQSLSRKGRLNTRPLIGQYDGMLISLYVNQLDLSTNFHVITLMLYANTEISVTLHTHYGQIGNKTLL